MRTKVPVLGELVQFPNLSGLALYQWHCKYVRTGARFVFAYEAKIKNFLVRGGSARSLEETEGVSPGAPVARFPAEQERR